MLGVILILLFYLFKDWCDLKETGLGVKLTRGGLVIVGLVCQLDPLKIM